MNAIAEWIEAHPVLFQVILWPLFSAAMTATFKPRTPEEYARLPPRWAGFLKLVGALGIDVPNLLNALRALVTGKTVPSWLYRQERAEALGVAKTMVDEREKEGKP